MIKTIIILTIVIVLLSALYFGFLPLKIKGKRLSGVCKKNNIKGNYINGKCITGVQAGEGRG